MFSPIVSVVMSVYNGRAFLTEAVDSILAQSYGDFEFIIIDDGSTDRTSEILSDYARRDARVRVLRHENQGRAASLNKGIGVAQTKYIARMDADDVALPQRFEKQVAFLEQHPDVGLLSGAYELIGTSGERLGILRLPLEDDEIRKMLKRHNAFCHPAVIMRKEAVLTAGGYRKALLDVDDYDLWLRISERSRVANLEDIILRYRMHADQVSVRKMGHQAECLFAARAAAERRQRGEADPLSNVDRITPELLASLGVTEAEIQRYLAGLYEAWIGILGESNGETTLQVTEEVLWRCDAEFVGRGFVANGWLRAAGIHYREGRQLRALLCAGRAVLVRPMVAGRPVKGALMRLAAAFKN